MGVIETACGRGRPRSQCSFTKLFFHKLGALFGVGTFGTKTDVAVIEFAPVAEKRIPHEDGFDPRHPGFPSD